VADSDAGARFVLLTSKPGRYRTCPPAGSEVVEHWEYRFCGRAHASHMIVRIEGARLAATRIRIVDVQGPPVINEVPVKFIALYRTPAAARAVLEQLVTRGGGDSGLHPLPLPGLPA